MHLVSQQLWDNLHLDTGRGRVYYEVKYGEDHYEVVMEVPGVPRDAIEVNLEERRLHVNFSRGEKKYSRYFDLSEEIDRENIEAQCLDGVLTIRLPKKKKDVRKISVK